MVNFGPLTAEICWRVWGTPCKFQRVSRLGTVTARHCSSGRQPNFAALNRGRHLYSAGRPSRWALAHILVVYFTPLCFGLCMNVDRCNYFAAASGAKYCDERVRMFVCLSARIAKAARPNFAKVFLYMFRSTVAQSYSDHSAVRYVFPLLWMKSCLPISVTKVAQQVAARGEV